MLDVSPISSVQCVMFRFSQSQDILPRRDRLTKHADQKVLLLRKYLRTIQGFLSDPLALRLALVGLL